MKGQEGTACAFGHTTILSVIRKNFPALSSSKDEFRVWFALLQTFKPSFRPD